MEEITAEKQDQERENVIELKRPYVFEQKEYTEIDLSGLAKLTIQDAVDAQLQAYHGGEVAAMLNSETTTAFAQVIAAKASGLPIEFFKLARRGVCKKVTATVLGFLSTEKETVNHVMKLEKPYSFQGNVYTEIDLSGVDSLNGMNEKEAENRVTRAGFMITETTYNYLYACCVASMATQKPVEFFTGLPIYEVLKLKSAVNDPDFFE